MCNGKEGEITMKYVTEFEIPDNLPTAVKQKTAKNPKITYINVPMAFDIETTSTEADGEKFAFMYEWTFGISVDDQVNICYGRTWEEFINLMNNMVSRYELNESNRIVIYVHNLAFEFQFMRKFFDWIDVFASDERKPIKAITSSGIEFRDSYILSGYSLSKLAENLTSHKIEKLMGDLDYTLCRLPSTPLTDEELAYCNNDVEIVLDYINEQIAQYGNVIRIPATNTGRVRRFVRERCLYEDDPNHSYRSTGTAQRYRKLMRECQISYDDYVMLKRCFMGGFTHASMKWSGMKLENVSSIDFTSSYPAVMLMEKFPMGRPIKVDLTKESFKSLLDSEEWGMMMDVKFIGIHAKNTYESYLSESKCFDIVNPQINNGRIFSADSLTTTITDVDLKIIKQCYDIDKIAVANCYKFYMQYLPRKLLLAILELYGNKTSLKGVKGKEVEYLVSKGMLNSCYGMCVTDIVKDEQEYSENHWSTVTPTIDSLNGIMDTYNGAYDRVLYYPWGIWITAYARRNLWMGILNIGEDYVYSDTDSIKFLNLDKHKDFVTWYNALVAHKLHKMCDFMKIDFNLCQPKTIKGVTKLIGVWDFEGTYTKFKTLGAKRYIYEQDGELHITIAGLNKSNGVEYMMQKCNNNVDDVFDMFTDELYIPQEFTGKNTHTYIDTEMTADITDYLGNTETITSPSSVHLSGCDFTLSISKGYAKFLDMLRHGYLDLGRGKL